MRVLATILALMTIVPATVRAAPDQWVEGGYLGRDLDTEQDGGLRAAAGMTLLPRVEGFGEIAATGDFEQFSLGAAGSRFVARDLALIAGISLEYQDRGGESATGLGLRAGAEWRVPHVPLLLESQIRHCRFEAEALTALRLGARYPLVPGLLASAAVQTGDDDRIEAGLRFVFDRRR